MSAKTAIFLLGGTGYIGGSVLTRFIQHPNASHFDITVLVRSEEKAKKLEPFGVRTVVGSLSDTDKLEELASQSKVVVACANADDLTAARALLKGLKKRHYRTGEIPIFIQTSGTGVLRDNAVGMFPTSTIYYDSDPDQMETLAPTQPHRNVDLAIVDADKQGFVKTYIILHRRSTGLHQAHWSTRES
ncbi:hypothetical protein A0H81_07905 [Grifola frondosa]|uniref:NAD(P)-binding domain-containing protein n=1 Tax=Grifola frondosa TaxID=5627 RepID=A0A1C7M6W9_GRIFR|nr:hypothetical protein A0H81_07905 [Grifola frondosa]